MSRPDSTLAECPDCGQNLIWQTDASLFRCSCDGAEALLAVVDIYLEWNETWTTTDDGRLVIVQADVTDPWWLD